tara:strand:- start:349 stop:693 length:345 start_codon:yes stop_codon:yes gene_type:complete
MLGLNEKLQLSKADLFEKYFNPGTYILREGGQTTGLYVLLKGGVSISKNLTGPQKLKILKPGSVFGEVSLLSKKPRSTNVLAEDKMIVLEINENNINDLKSEIVLKIQKNLLIF